MARFSRTALHSRFREVMRGVMREFWPDSEDEMNAGISTGGLEIMIEQWRFRNRA